MQRFLAILLILAGLGGIGYGVATATVLRESDTVVATATPSGDGTMVVTEPGVLGLVDDQVTVRATVPEGQKVTLALGSDVDVLGWVGQDPYDSVTGLSSWETLSVVPGAAPEGEATEGEAAEEPAGQPGTGPDPAGSDMWISEVTGETRVQMRWTEQPGRTVLLAAGVGEGAQAPTLEFTWPRPVNTPLLWPGVLGGGFLLILGIFLAIGARRKNRGSGKGRSSSAGRTRKADSDPSRRDTVFEVDGDRSSPAAHEPAAGFPPALGDPADGGTAVYPPAAAGRELPGRDRPERGRPERGRPERGRPEHEPVRPPERGLPDPEQDHTRTWGAPAPFGGAAPITPPPVPEQAPEPVAAPAASVRGIRRRRGQAPGAAPAPTGQPSAERTPFGGAAPDQAPASPQAPAAARAEPAAPAASGKPLTRREMRLREQAQLRAATGAMPTVPASEPEPEPEPETPSSRAAAWRQTWGVTGNDGGNQ
ncbi:hypothetical protein [Promicromonospora sp. NPDC050249]|uniref:hypothetical protein n=1 Tax=Promicromonospora sp. NPDC050249 TaxID=3154743 RepID=UPI0033FE4FE2